MPVLILQQTVGYSIFASQAPDIVQQLSSYNDLVIDVLEFAKTTSSTLQDMAQNILELKVWITNISLWYFTKSITKKCLLSTRFTAGTYWKYNCPFHGPTCGLYACDDVVFSNSWSENGIRSVQLRFFCNIKNSQLRCKWVSMKHFLTVPFHFLFRKFIGWLQFNFFF